MFRTKNMFYYVHMIFFNNKFKYNVKFLQD